MTAPRIVALDMDGTLVDSSGTIPEAFWGLLDRALDAGIVIAPASGRQLATLQHMFSRNEPDTFIAENGAVVWHKGEIVSVSPLAPGAVHRLAAALDTAPFRAHAVLCKPEISYTAANTPPAIQAEVDKYYLANAPASSLLDALSNDPDDTVKVALYVETDAERDALPWLGEVVPELNATVSSHHWIDLMAPGVNKGVALRALAETLGVALADAAAIGDYLNDYAMLEEAGWAVAMGNAHPDLKAIADEVVGTNDEHGALDRIERWITS